MKILVNIIKFILITILTISIIAIGIINIVSSTILNQKYIINKLEETNFYSEMYELTKSNFENYIYQSGLEKEVLENICTKEKVENDINLMLSNIYQGTNEKIDTTEIETNLKSNIDKIGIKNSKNENAINEFVKHICNEYTDTLIHTNYEKNINEIFNKVNNVLTKINNIILPIMIVTIILLIITNLKEISKNLQDLGIGLFAIFAFNLITCKIVSSKVNIEGIKIFNDTFSKSVVAIIQDVIQQIITFGLITLGISILLMLIYAVIIIIKKDKSQSVTIEK